MYNDTKPNNREIAALLPKQQNTSHFCTCAAASTAGAASSELCSHCQNEANARQSDALIKQQSAPSCSDGTSTEQLAQAQSVTVDSCAPLHDVQTGAACFSSFDDDVNLCKLEPLTDSCGVAPPSPPTRLDSKNIFLPDAREKDIADKDTNKVLCDADNV